MDGDVLANQPYLCYHHVAIPASVQFASLYLFLFLGSTSHAVLLLDFALKHHLVKKKRIKMMAWKVWLCVCVWVNVSIIINILQKVKA